MPSLPGPARARLRPSLEAIVGRHGVLTEPDELLVYESDGLTIFRATADAVVFPRSTEEVAACVRFANAEVCRSSPAGGDGPRRRVPAERGRDRHRAHPHGPDPRGGLREPGRRSTGPGELHLSQALARPGSTTPRTHRASSPAHRRQHRQQLGRAAHAEVRRDDEPRARPRGRAADGRWCGSGQGAGPSGLRPRRPLRGLGRHLRHRDEGRRTDRASPPAVRTLLAVFAQVDQASRAVAAVTAAGSRPRRWR